MPLSRRRKTAYASFAVLLALFAAEGAARLLLALRPPPPLEAAAVAGGNVGTRWFELLVEDLGAPEGARLYRPDPELFWTLRPSFEADLVNVCYGTVGPPVTWRVTIDAHGRRVTPDDGRGGELDGPVVVCAGDSVTFGFRVSDDETFASLLPDALRRHGVEGASVVNLGVPGYSSHQGRLLLERALEDLRPDVVLIGYGANDLEADARSDAAKTAANSTPAARLGRLLSHLALARLVRGPESTARTPPSDEGVAVRRVSPEETLDNLRAMVRAARAAGARPILLDLVFAGDLFGTTLARLAEEVECPVLDGRAVLHAALSDLLAGRAHREARAERDRFWSERVTQYRRVYYDAAFYDAWFADPVRAGWLRYLLVEPVHPSPLGHRVLADAIAETMLE